VCVCVCVCVCLCVCVCVYLFSVLSPILTTFPGIWLVHDKYGLNDCKARVLIIKSYFI
jgi:hypothetical protein